MVILLDQELWNLVDNGKLIHILLDNYDYCLDLVENFEVFLATVVQNSLRYIPLFFKRFSRWAKQKLSSKSSSSRNWEAW